MSDQPPSASRDELDAIYESAPLGLCVLSLDGRFQRINARLAEINGLPAAWHIGAHVADVVPSLADKAEALIARIVATGEAISGVELEGETASQPGVKRCWNTHYWPIRDGAGQIVAINVAVEEITERRRAEATLRATEAKTHAILEALPLGVGVIDRNGRLTLANAVFRAYVPDQIPSRDKPRTPLWEAYDDHCRRIGPDDYAGARALRGETVVPGIDFLYHGPGQPPRWTRVAAVPQRGAGGDVTGAIVTILDIDNERRALDALREQQQLLQSIYANGSLAIFIMNERQECVFMNPAAEQLTGFSLAEVQGRALHDVIHHTRPDGSHYPLSECPIDQALPKNDRESGEEVFVHRQGHFYDVRFTASPIRDALGISTGTVIEVEDITSRKRDEQRLKQSEALFRTVSEALPNLVFLHDSEGRNAFVNRSFCTFAGREPEGLLEDRWIDLIHPEDIAGAWERWVAAVGRALPFESEYRFRRHDGEWRWHLVRTVPLVVENGKVWQWIGTATDITARIESEQKIRTLMKEVNHRSKNLLAVVQAVANNTAKTGDPAHFTQRLTERLQGLAASHDLLVHSLWKGVAVADLVRSQLAHFADLVGTRIALNGPPLRVNAAAAQSIGMALHELLTNAVKHGSLSCESGTLDICWTLTPEDAAETFTLTWAERGGPPVEAPSRQGFGSRIMGRLIEQSLQGKVEMNFAPQGFSWSITAPAGAVLETAG